MHVNTYYFFIHFVNNPMSKKYGIYAMRLCEENANIPSSLSALVSLITCKHILFLFNVGPHLAITHTNSTRRRKKYICQSDYLFINFPCEPEWIILPETNHTRGEYTLIQCGCTFFLVAIAIEYEICLITICFSSITFSRPLSLSLSLSHPLSLSLSLSYAFFRVQIKSPARKILSHK